MLKGLFKRKELNYKSKAISLMYLYKAKAMLEEEVASKKRNSGDSVSNANYDIQCLEDTIAYLESD